MEKANHYIDFPTMWNLKGTSAGEAFGLFTANSSGQAACPCSPNPSTPPTAGHYRVVKYYQYTSPFGTIPLGDSNTLVSRPVVTLQDETFSGAKFKYIQYYTIGEDYPTHAINWAASVKTHTGKMIHTGDYTNSTGNVNFEPAKTMVILYEYVPGTGTGISTYNEPKKPNIPDGPEEYPNDPKPKHPDDPNKYPKDPNTITITKSYRYRDSTGKLTTEAYLVQENAAPHDIKIVDEYDLTEKHYRLIKYTTADTFYVKEAEGRNSNFARVSSFEEKIWPYSNNQFKNEFKGTTIATQITIPPNTSKVLHLLFERTDTAITEQKHYLDEDGNETFTPDPIIPVTTNPYVVPDKPGFEFVEIKPNVGPPTTTPVYPIPTGVTHIDIYYRMKSKKIILYSQDLSRNYQVRNLVDGDKLFDVYDKAAAIPSEHWFTHDSHSCCHCTSKRTRHKRHYKKNTRRFF